MIYLIRHGQTDWNLLNQFNGCTETHLTDLGIAQAKRQAEKLKGISFDAAFCSTQIRAREALKFLYKGPAHFDERLIEIDCGDFEGTQENPESMKRFWQAVMTGAEGTEHFKGFIKRNCSLCETIAKEYAGKNVLIVTHAANARVINYYFTGQSKTYDFSKAIAQDGAIVTYEN